MAEQQRLGQGSTLGSNLDYQPGPKSSPAKKSNASILDFLPELITGPIQGGLSLFNSVTGNKGKGKPKPKPDDSGQADPSAPAANKPTTPDPLMAQLQFMAMVAPFLNQAIDFYGQQGARMSQGMTDTANQYAATPGANQDYVSALQAEGPALLQSAQAAPQMQFMQALIQMLREVQMQNYELQQQLQSGGGGGDAAGQQLLQLLLNPES